MPSFGAHRYWRLFFNTTAGNAYAMAEVQFRTTPGTPLLFSGGTAQAAQVYQTPTYTADKATDNNTATFWGGTDTTPAQWWQYDYGAGVTIDIQEVTITARNDSFYAQAPSRFHLQYSDDGITFTTINPAFNATWTVATQTQVFTIPAGALASGTMMEVTQAALEEWAPIVLPPMQVTQAVLEQWAPIVRPPMALTQVAIEQWGPPPPFAGPAQMDGFATVSFGGLDTALGAAVMQGIGDLEAVGASTASGAGQMDGLTDVAFAGGMGSGAAQMDGTSSAAFVGMNTGGFYAGAAEMDGSTDVNFTGTASIFASGAAQMDGTASMLAVQPGVPLPPHAAILAAGI